MASRFFEALADESRLLVVVVCATEQEDGLACEFLYVCGGMRGEVELHDVWGDRKVTVMIPDEYGKTRTAMKVCSKRPTILLPFPTEEKVL